MTVKDFRDGEIPFSTARIGVHEGFAEILRSVKSSEAARYFDIDRKTINKWAQRRWVPIPNWRALARLCADNDREETLETFVEWGFQAGLEKIDVERIQWTAAEAKKCIRSLKNFAAKMRVGWIDLDEFSQDAFYRMLEAGVRDINYGFEIISKERFKYRKSLPIAVGDEIVGMADSFCCQPLTPERIVCSRDELRFVSEIAEKLPENLKSTFDLLCRECDDDDVAAAMRVSRRHAQVLRLAVRQQLRGIMEAETA